MWLGISDGTFEGGVFGRTLGESDGFSYSFMVGNILGSSFGLVLGSNVGLLDGKKEGSPKGFWLRNRLRKSYVSLLVTTEGSVLGFFGFK